MNMLLKCKFYHLKYMAVSAALTLVPSILLAQTASNTDEAAVKQRDWKVTLGVGILTAPEYFGSKKMMIQPLPIIDISWKNRVFINSLEGAGVYIINDETSGLSVSASVVPNITRDSKTIEARLRGLGDIKFAAQARLSASYTLLDFFKVSASIGKDLGGTKGFQATAGISAMMPLNDKLAIGAGVSTRYFDLKTAQGLFGVTPIQSANTGFAVYTPKAGLDSVTLSLNGTYALSSHINMIMFLSAEQRLGSSKRSPIIQRKTDPAAAIGLSYTF
jgi:MipA family protein